MKKIISLFLLTIISMGYSQDLDSILKEADRVITPPFLHGEFSIRLISKNEDVRNIRALAYQKQENENQENRLFLFSFPPAVKGTSLLVHSYFDDRDNRMWMYLPSVKRIKRIALEKSGGGNFMGSDFTFNDLISKSSEDFNYVLLEDQEVNGVLCFTIRSQGKTEKIQQSVGYSYTVGYYRKSDYLIFGIDYYDLAGELLKEYRVIEVHELPGYLWPSKVVMKNVQNGHRSEIEFTSIVMEDIPDKFFTYRYLQTQ